MPTYTMKDVQEANRLYDRMPMRDVAEETGISSSTLSNWKQKGLIDTDANHRTKHSAQDISRASELWDAMPLPQVSELMEIPLSTLRYWSRKCWIETDKDWNVGYTGGRSKACPPRPVVEMYFQSDLTMKEVGDSFGISRFTVGDYVRKYRNGDL